MSAAKHTPGPYTVQKAVVKGYRGGQRHIGWLVVRDGTHTSFFKYKASADEHARKCNDAIAKATGSAS